MPDHSSDAAPASAEPSADSPSEAEAERSASRTDWRLGGRTVARWRESLLAAALISLGLAILAGTLIEWLWQSPWAAASATALLWAGMLVPVAWALTLSRPAGLLTFRAVDLLYGIALAGMLRLAQGWLEQAFQGNAAFPSYPLVGGRLSDLWWLTDVVAVVVLAPVVEEFFFRAVILVSVFSMLRRPFGRTAAAIAAIVVSAAVFVVIHGLTLGAGPDQLIAIGLLGVVCATLVMLTGRIWGAVLVHAFFNASYVILALTGTFLM